MSATVIQLSPLDLILTAGLILALGILSLVLRLGFTQQLWVAAVRATVQLLLIGFVLEAIFAASKFIWVTLMALVMLAMAAREAIRRQNYRFQGWYGFIMGTFSMFVTSFSVAFFALAVVIQNQPWYQPQYAIPILGMMLGNTMNGISLGLDRLTSTTRDQRQVIENRLMLGETWSQAISHIRRDCVRSGMIPMLNSMAVAGLVSLPGMMTGQILAGNAPLEAVKYQIMIFFLIVSSVGFGTITAVYAASRHFFDDRHRLRLDRLRPRRESIFKKWRKK